MAWVLKYCLSGYFMFCITSNSCFVLFQNAIIMKGQLFALYCFELCITEQISDLLYTSSASSKIPSLKIVS